MLATCRHLKFSQQITHHWLQRLNLSKKNYNGDSILIIAVAYFLQVHVWKDVHWVPTWDAGNQMFSILQLDALFPPLTVIGHCAGDLLLKQLESAAACLSPPKVFTHTGRGFKAIKWECRKQTQPNLSIFSIFLVLYLRTCSLIWFLYQKETIDNMGTFLICWHLWVTVHWQNMLSQICLFIINPLLKLFASVLCFPPPSLLQHLRPRCRSVCCSQE